MAGNLPFSSQARKKNCQSISSRSSASGGVTARTPVKAGSGRSVKSGRSPFGAVLYRTTPLFLKLFGIGLAAAKIYEKDAKADQVAIEVIGGLGA